MTVANAAPETITQPTPLWAVPPLSNQTAPPSNTSLAPAVTYLRVSTKEQAERGGRDEGFSIPAQRAANERKAESLGATIVREFVDAGESGRSADRRDLQRMLTFVKENNIKYCIVHKLDRLARSRADDVAIHFALQQAGVTLVSTTENIDETPSGMLMHGIMSSIAEFYSRNLASEVAKGMSQKASLGGTVGRAPLGYRNIAVTDELGRTYRTVEVDAVRGHLITWAFFRYAEGESSISSLLKELTARGLTSRPTPKVAAKPLTLSALHNIMHNPYYKGEIFYNGVRYPGKHQPLVDPATWQRVQDLLAANNLGGVRQARHDHYLKGSLYCGSCGHRLAISNHRNRWGTIYRYFICSGRQRRRTTCTRQAMLIETAEDLVTKEYTTVALSPKLRTSVEEGVLRDFDLLHENAEQERRDLEEHRTVLTEQRAKLLEAHYAGAIPMDVLKSEQDRIAGQLLHTEHRLATATESYEKARQNLAACLDMAQNCHAAYLEADDRTKRLINQGFFKKIYIDEDGTVRFDYNPPYDQLLRRTIHAGVHQRLQTNGTLRSTEALVDAETQSAPQTSLEGTTSEPSVLFSEQGSDKSDLVGRVGLEPTTEGL